MFGTKLGQIGPKTTVPSSENQANCVKLHLGIYTIVTKKAFNIKFVLAFFWTHPIGIFNRPGAAGAVLQIPLALIN